MLKYDKFVNVNETKKTEEIEKVLDELFTKCPSVSKSNDLWPKEKCVYSLSGIKSFVRSKISSLKDNTSIDQCFNSYSDKLQSISVKNFEYDENYPYYYNSEKVTKEEAKKIKEEYEKYSKEHTSKKKT